MVGAVHKAAMMVAVSPVLFMASGAAWSSQTVPVPRTVIYSGDRISDDALEDRQLNLGADPDRWHTKRENLVGKVARRTLLPGQPIPTLAVKAPDLVAAGKPVMLLFSSGQLSISGRGIAMQAGGLGAEISVQNTDSNTIVRGVVAADGSVRVGD